MVKVKLMGEKTEIWKLGEKTVTEWKLKIESKVRVKRKLRENSVQGEKRDFFMKF